MRSRLIVVALVLLAGVLAGTPAEAALGAFGPPVQIFSPGCSFTDGSADAVLGGDGRMHGWAQLTGGTCGATPAIHYFEGAGDAWTEVETPYVGNVLGAAWDTTGTYLLYQAADGVHITKRTSTGQLTPGRRIGPPTDFVGDLVARGGKWWAVWVEAIGGQTDLFQAGTFSSPQTLRKRITYSGEIDFFPSLALSPVADRMALVWDRGDELSHLRFATARFDGAWSSRAFTGSDGSNMADLIVTATRTVVAWQNARSDRIVEVDNLPGPWVGHVFNTTGNQPKLALASGRLVVGWSTAADPGRAFVAERTGSTWSGRYASPPAPRQQGVVAVGVIGAKITAVIFGVGTRIYAVTET